MSPKISKPCPATKAFFELRNLGYHRLGMPAMDFAKKTPPGPENGLGGVLQTEAV
jgi:hypothetical protein